MSVWDRMCVVRRGRETHSGWFSHTLSLSNTHKNVRTVREVEQECV